MRFSGIVHAADAPYTVGITVYDDVRNRRRFVDLNNTDIDVETDTIHPALVVRMDLAMPAWLDSRTVAARVLTPDGAAVIAETMPQAGGKLSLTVRGLKRYASIVLSAGTQKTPAAAASIQSPARLR
jgi:hypothetical protein